MERRPVRVAGAVIVMALLTIVSGCAQARARLRAAAAPAPVVRVTTTTTTVGEKALIARINQLRAAHGLRPLSVHPVLMNKARSWSRWMATGGCGRDANGVPTICHSSLAAGITVPWTFLAENVGSAAPRTIVGAVETGFEHSPPHLANLLNGREHYVGVGIAYSSNSVYVAEEFMTTP